MRKVLLLALLTAAVALLALSCTPGFRAEPRGGGSRPLAGRTDAAATGNRPEGRDPSPAPETIPYAGYALRLVAAYDLAREGPEGAAILRAALRDPVPEVRAAAALALLHSKHSDRADVLSLEGLLGDDDWSVRFAAGLALVDLSRSGECGNLDGPRMPVDEILARLAEGNEATRADAARVFVLAFRADEGRSASVLYRALPNLSVPLVSLMREMLGAPDVTSFALRTIGCCGDAGAAAADEIVPSRFEDPCEKADAARALLRLGCKLDEALPTLTLCDLANQTDTQALAPVLRASLKGDGPITPESALRVVCAIGPNARGCVPEVLRLGDTEELKPLVACALGRIGEAAAPAVPWLLAESEVSRTWNVASHSDLPEAPRRLLAPLDPGPRIHLGPSTLAFEFVPDYSGDAAEFAFLALGHIAPKDPQVVRAAARRLEDANPRVRIAALDLLTDALCAGDVPAGPFLARFERDMVEGVRIAAASALASAATVENVTLSLRQADGFAAAPGEQIVPCLTVLLEQGDPLSTEYAARALAWARQPKPLAKALESDRIVTRTWAAAALLLVDVSARFSWEQQGADEERKLRSRAPAIIEAALVEGDPPLKELAVMLIGNYPEHFRETWHEDLVTAANDGELDGVMPEVWLRYWEKHTLPWDEDDSIGPEPPTPREDLDELLRDMRGEGRPTPIDVVLQAAGSDAARRTLPAIAADPLLFAFERWFAGQEEEPHKRRNAER